MAALALAAAGAAAGAGSQPLGAILGWGDFQVDRLPAPEGTLVFPGDVVTTAANSGAELRFVSGSIARLEAGSAVALDGAAGDVDLRQGALTLKSPAGRAARARVLGAQVVVGAAASSTCRLQTGSGSAWVAAVAGRVVIEGAGNPLVLAAGHSARLGRASERFLVPQTAPPVPQASSAAPAPARAVTLVPEVHTAGRVVAVYPDEVVRHPGSEIATPLIMGELVDAGDILGTLGPGRVRIQLFDNSIFDLGAATTVRLVQHDPDARSTLLELRGGYLHAEVAPAQGPKAGFVVTTPHAEVSASATMFFVSTDAKATVVCNAGSGPLLVRSPAVAAGAVSVAAGECSITHAQEAPGPSHADRALIEREMWLAGYQDGPGIPGLARREAIKKARTTAISGAAALSLVTLIEMYRTSTDLQHVASDAQPYVSAFGNAVGNFEGAIQIEHNLCLAFLNWGGGFGLVLSPSVPAQVCPSVGP
ncbi:MAG TPA: FecR domain-containing protein [Terriglobia bacterium]|nr:FecR domain-containing protein [Terriglobia bacterium]